MGGFAGLTWLDSWVFDYMAQGSLGGELQAFLLTTLREQQAEPMESRDA